MWRNRERLVTVAPSEKLQASVVVPARNEEELLPNALRALAEQKNLDGRWFAPELYEVILLINNSTDRSRQVAESFQRLYPNFRLHIAERAFNRAKAHVGHARRLLMDEACSRLEAVGRADAAILSTDADSQVAPNWIAQNLRELERGADAVGGRIVIPPWEQELLSAATQDLQRYDHVYGRLVSWIEDRLDPETHDAWPRHQYHFGASLAVRPEIYKAVGRLPPRRRLEDCAFYDLLMRHDVRLRHSNKVRVFTSARLSGRTRAGLSTQLSEWAKSGKNVLRMRVETGAFLEHLFAARQQLRLLWKTYRGTGELANAPLGEVSKKMGVTATHLTEKVKAARYFGVLMAELEFYETCRKTWPEWVRLGPLKEIVEELQTEFKEDQRRRQSVSANGHSRSVQVASGSKPAQRA